MNVLSKYHLLVLVSLFLLGCNSGNTQKAELSETPKAVFDDYWYSGKAELSRYEVEQARYGELHTGEAVLIFVTEEFRNDKQVKYEGGDRKNVVPILKLNATKKFFTGLYPYSLMTSVFSPTDLSQTLKVTATSQEWCGHTFYQLNLRKGKYNGQLNSYFQNEGDQNFEIDDALLEDEIWTKIRLNPSVLPQGQIEIIPGSQYLRLKHKEIKVATAEATLVSYNGSDYMGKSLTSYIVNYTDLNRKLTVIFESNFPHAIVGWEEEIDAGFGSSQKLTTKAKRTNTMMSPYWNKNGLRDVGLRKELGLNSGNY